MQSLTLPNDLRDVILGGDCVAFIGSGASSGVFPTWHALVQELCNLCMVDSPIDHDSAAIQLLRAAERAKRAAGPAYWTHLGTLLAKKPTHTNFLYRTLLSLPFKAYFTTNFDPLLALAARDSAQRPCEGLYAYPHLDRQKMAERAVFYLHGYVAENAPPPPDTIVLAESDFEEAYEDNSILMSFLGQALDHDHICFIGCSLREPKLQRVFALHQERKQRLDQRIARDPSLMFIFRAVPSRVKADETKVMSAKQEQREGDFYHGLGIRPIWYGNGDGEHTDLHRTLENLAKIETPIPEFRAGGGVSQ